MAFTYDLTETGTALLISKVRLEIGDSIEDAGVKPDGSNFSDAELTYILSEEGSEVGAATARCFEILAGWFAAKVNSKAGPLSEALSDKFKHYKEQAEAYRAKYGGGAPAAGYGIIRVDGFSDDVPSDDVDPQGEYGAELVYVVPERG